MFLRIFILSFSETEGAVPIRKDTLSAVVLLVPKSCFKILNASFKSLYLTSISSSLFTFAQHCEMIEQLRQIQVLPNSEMIE